MNDQDNPEPFTLKITGFTSKAQIEAFVGWYEGQGEQDSSMWFEYRKEEGKIDVDSMNVNLQETYTKGKMKFDGNTGLMVIRPQ